jgi:hypothetical protein
MLLLFRVQFGHQTLLATAKERLVDLYKAWRVAVEDLEDVSGFNPTFVLNSVPRRAQTVALDNGVGNV